MTIFLSLMLLMNTLLYSEALKFIKLIVSSDCEGIIYYNKYDILENSTAGEVILEIELDYPSVNHVFNCIPSACSNYYSLLPKDNVAEKKFRIELQNPFTGSSDEKWCRCTFQPFGETGKCFGFEFNKIDVNNYIPILSKQYSPTIYIEENAKVPEEGRSIFNVTAKDENDESDYGTAGIIFQLEPSNPENFRLLSNGNDTLKIAEIILVDTLDYETRSIYNFELFALDNHGVIPFQKSSIQIVIKVEDVDDHGPEFIKQVSVAKIPEDTPVGSFVLAVYAEDQDKGNPNTISYSIEGDGSDHFTINNATGEVTVKTPLDRELLNGKIGYELTIWAIEISEKQTNNSVQSTIIIDDVNDCSPEFQKAIYKGSIYEEAIKDSTVLLDYPIIVKDDDLGENASFTVICSNDKFAITPNSGIQQGYFLLLINDSNIDFDTLENNTISVMLEAIDAKNNSMKSSVEVQVTVNDINDNSPYFLNSPYTAQIYEDVKRGTFVLTVTAKDNDSSTFGTDGIRYSFKEQNKFFIIHEISGNITVNGTLDREELEIHSLIVTATDDNGNGRSSSVEVTITLLDVNNKPPKIVKRNDVFEISENANISTIIMVVIGVDNDNGENGSLTFSFDDNTDSNISECLKFENIDNKSAQILVSKSLHGIVGYRELGIIATDHGTPYNKTSEAVNFTLNVIDENDQPQIITPEKGQAFYVMENVKDMPEDMYIYATDEDKYSPANNRLKYEVLNYDNTFTVNLSNYHIILTNAFPNGLDREARSEYNISLQVCDSAQVPLCAQRKFTLFVNNTNDNFPLFPTSEISIDFTEELSPDDVSNYQELILATDKDNNEEKTFDDICYIILGENSDVFVLNETSNKLILKPRKVLDHENQSKYTLKILATNECHDKPIIVNSSDSSAGYRILNVHIEVLDINDNAPSFDDSLFISYIDVTDNKQGSEILQLKATDEDSEKNAVKKFYITSSVILYGNENEDDYSKYIQLEENTGKITTLRSFAPDKSGFLNFSVLVNNTEKLITKHNHSHINTTANVKLYLLNEKHRLLLILHKSVDEFNKDKSVFESLIMSLLPKNYILNIAKVTVHTVVNMCKVYTFFINKNDYSIVEPSTVEKILDETSINDKSKIDLNNMFGVENIRVGEENYISEDNSQYIIQVLIITVIGLTATLLILLLALYCARVSRLQRQLKAATVPTYNSNEEKIKKKESTLPNTNLHMTLGSNPIWNLEDNDQNIRNETSDDISIQSEDNIVPNTKDFEGGNYNEGFAGMVEQMFLSDDISTIENTDHEAKYNDDFSDNFTMQKNSDDHYNGENATENHSTFADLSITDI